MFILFVNLTLFPVGLSSAGRHLALPVSLWGQQLPVLDEAFSYSPSPWTLGCSSEGQGRSSDRFGDLSSCLPLGYSASTQNLGWLSGWVLCCWWPCTVGPLSPGQLCARQVLLLHAAATWCAAALGDELLSWQTCTPASCFSITVEMQQRSCSALFSGIFLCVCYFPSHRHC